MEDFDFEFDIEEVLCFFFAIAVYFVKYETSCSMLFSTLSIVGISL